MATILEFKCPCCSGDIKFDAELQKMRCQYCDTEFDKETLEEFNEAMPDGASDGEPDWSNVTSDKAQWTEGDSGDGVGVYVCSSCGGEIVGDETTAATSCPFCGSSVILAGNLTGTYKPDYVIPFKITKEEAKAAMKKFLEKKPLLPNSFREDSRIESIRGMYVPFWLFDCEADAAIKYRATRVRHWSDSNYNYTRTDHFLLLRAGDIAFEKVPVDGSSKMDDSYMEEILGSNDGSHYEILLAHNPDYFKQYAFYGADLTLAGHVHGGIVRMPFMGGIASPAVRFFPKYNGGLYRQGKANMIVSCGLGTHTLPMRIFNPAELAVIRIKPACKDE